MKHYLASFKALTKLERALWLSSVCVILLSFLLSGKGDILTLIASLIGVTALIFIAKGYVLGQILTVVFALFYGVISFYFHYYGELITYIFMTAPMAVVSAVAWIRHPYRDSDEVQVHSVTKQQLLVMLLLAAVVTGIFYFVLRALGTAHLIISTISITTSFFASYLTYLRSPYYALGYSANDLILILLWILASVEDRSYIPMVACFAMFLLNDLYGFYNWQKMKQRQK